MASLFCFVYNMVRKHETTKTTPAMALGIVQERWTLERVVEMTDEYLKGKEDADFEAAFANFTVRPKPSRVTEPTAKDKLLTPWYLDPESGGPNPTVKKADIQYDLHMTENE